MLSTLVVVVFLSVVGSVADQLKQKIFQDSLALWDLFRDTQNGAYCDGISLKQDPATIPCGAENNFYSIAGTGMGLVIKTVMAEVNYTHKSVAQAEIIQTLNTVMNLWPKEASTGFWVHFTDRKFSNNTKIEYSTVDSAELVLGALFAGNYFQGEVLRLANSLRDSVDWSAAIKSSNEPQIFAQVDASTGELSGDIRPFNEYYLVAYLALITSGADSKAYHYFNTYLDTNGGEPVGDGQYPVHKSYHQYDLLSDQRGKFMSSFIPQFCFFLTKCFQVNPFYQQMLHQWFLADQLYYSKELFVRDANRKVPIQGRLFGAGAGPGLSGYSVQGINGSHDMDIASVAIMAGFLPAAVDSERASLNKQLEWLYSNDICTYPIAINGTQIRIKILWRCSVRDEDWQCGSVDSIDYSTFTLGYASNFVSPDFFFKYAA